MKTLMLMLVMLYSNLSYASPQPKAQACTGNLSEMHHCHQAAFKAEDKRLNDAFKTLKATAMQTLAYDAELQQRYWQGMLNAQRAWIKMKMAQCQAKVFYVEEGTPTYDIEMNTCLTALTQARADTLEAEVEWLHSAVP